MPMFGDNFGDIRKIFRKFGQSNSASPAVTVLALGARITSFGHSKISMSSSPGERNQILQTITRLNGRLRPQFSGDQGIGGQTISQIYARVNNVIAEKPDIVIIQADHNSLNDGSASVIAGNQQIDDALATGTPNTIRIWLSETPSNLYPTGNATLTAVNNDLSAKASGKRMFIDTATGFDPNTMTYDGTHENRVGAQYVAGKIFAALDTLASSQTVLQALADTSAAREHGANVDQWYAAMPTTGGTGTKTGTGSANITGTVPDGGSIANATTASINVVGIDTYNGMARITIDITGSGVTEGLIQLTRQNISGGRVPINAIIGDTIEHLVGVEITATDGVSPPTGLMQRSFNGGAFSFANPVSTDANLGTSYNAGSAITGAGETQVIGPVVERTRASFYQTALANQIVTYGVRVAGTVSIRLKLYGFIARKTDLVAYAAPFYIGGDGIHSSSGQINNSAGVTSLVNGTAYTFRPGEFVGGQFSSVTPQIDISTDGGTTYTAAGTQPSATWVWTPSGYASGTKVRLTATVVNPQGTGTAQAVFTIS